VSQTPKIRFALVLVMTSPPQILQFFLSYIKTLSTQGDRPVIDERWLPFWGVSTASKILLFNSL